MRTVPEHSGLGNQPSRGVSYVLFPVIRESDFSREKDGKVARSRRILRHPNRTVVEGLASEAWSNSAWTRLLFTNHRGGYHVTIGKPGNSSGSRLALAWWGTMANARFTVTRDREILGDFYFE
jgi:hypothetical protein